MKPTPIFITLASLFVAAGFITPRDAHGHGDVVSPKKTTGRRVASKVTYGKDIAPILYAKCSSCHHAGEVAPFTLMSYADAKAKAQTILAVAKDKYMPPWQAVSHGEFTNERTLSPEQIATLSAWVDAGAPMGPASEIPAPPKYTSGWQLGTPDFVGKPDRTYSIPAEGADVYRCFVVPTNFPEGRYVTGFEVKPGNHLVVHHVIAYLDTNGVAAKLDGKDGQPGYTSFGGPGFTPSGSLGGWAPGLGPQMLKAGEGMWLPKGADIVLQVHYHPDGKAEKDLTSVGVKFSTVPVRQAVRTAAVFNPILSIPAGDKSYEVKASLTLPKAITILDVLPHMHLLGHDMLVTAQLPDGTTKQLINVQGYDFNWQTRYAYKQPLPLPKGTKLNLVAHYDNSTDNPHNPNSPPKKVTFGEQTTDEMCFAFFSYTTDGEHLKPGEEPAPSGFFNIAGDTQSLIHLLFTQFDKDEDGTIDLAELTQMVKYFQETNKGEAGLAGVDPAVAAKYLMAQLDAKKDGKLTEAEFSAVAKLMGGKHGGGKSGGAGH